MSKNFSSVMKNVRNGITKNSAVIKTGVGIACFGLAVISAVRAKEKIDLDIYVKKQDLGLDENDKLPVKDTALIIAKRSWPVAVEFAAGVGCVVSSDKEMIRTSTGLAAACSIKDKLFEDYKAKVVETIGEKREKEVSEKVVVDQIKKNPPVPSQVIITGANKTLMYDSWSGRYFTASIDSLQAHVNDLNKDLNTFDYVSLNDFYYKIGLPFVDCGDYVGWRASKSGLVEIKPVPHMMENGEYVTGITFLVMPYQGYKEWD